MLQDEVRDGRARHTREANQFAVNRCRQHAELPALVTTGHHGFVEPGAVNWHTERVELDVVICDNGPFAGGDVVDSMEENIFPLILHKREDG